MAGQIRKNCKFSLKIFVKLTRMAKLKDFNGTLANKFPSEIIQTTQHFEDAKVLGKNNVKHVLFFNVKIWNYVSLELFLLKKIDTQTHNAYNCGKVTS